MQNSMTVPSGAIYGPGLVETVLQMDRTGVITWSDIPITLKDGSTSRIYVNGRNDLTEAPETLRRIGRFVGKRLQKFAESLDMHAKLCLIGLPTAATPIASAVGLECGIATRVMREVRKQSHGMHGRWVEGDPAAPYAYCTIDNVVTAGTTKREKFAQLAEDGYDPMQMIHVILVDRGQGAVEALRQEGYRVLVIFELSDILHVMKEHDCWPEHVMQEAIEEVSARKKAAPTPT